MVRAMADKPAASHSTASKAAPRFALRTPLFSKQQLLLVVRERQTGHTNWNGQRDRLQAAGVGRKRRQVNTDGVGEHWQDPMSHPKRLGAGAGIVKAETAIRQLVGQYERVGAVLNGHEARARNASEGIAAHAGTKRAGAARAGVPLLVHHQPHTL